MNKTCERAAMLRVWLISLAHGINDIYCEFLVTFTPYLKQSLGLDYAASGALNLIMGICYVLVQPLVGCIADKMRRPWLIMIGPIMASLGATMIPTARSYAEALFFVGIWSTGSALYHPQGNGAVGYVAPPEKLPISLTIFNLFGSGFAMLSPLLAVFMATHFGYDRVWLAIFPTLLLALVVYFAIPNMRAQVQDNAAKNANASGAVNVLASENEAGKSISQNSRRAVWLAMFLVCMIAFLRDFVLQGIRFMLPLKIASEGGSLANIGTVLFCVTLGEILLTIPAVALSRKIGFNWLLFFTAIIGTVCLVTATTVQGIISIALYTLGIAVIFSNVSLTVVIAQLLMPNARSAASALATGLTWGLSSTALFPLGALADWLGIHTTLVILSLIPLLMLLPLLSSTFRAIKLNKST